MLHQLIVAVGAAAGTFAGGLRIGMPPRCGNLCVRRLEAEADAVAVVAAAAAAADHKALSGGCRCCCCRCLYLAVPQLNAAAVVRVHAAAIAICKGTN